MRSTSARRELTFVLAVAAAGLVLVVAVVFTPWYQAGQGTAEGIPAQVAPVQVTQVTQVTNVRTPPAP